ncbi:hypothetical protein [Hamadaea tsunoensis]|uniref:hypothetical protein n=1 Tax=Hamadaea tsunoensis TaxID=53368 RepID=UPI0012F72517|nr:hypothetical protein [Hamadaea tsunoensis]
MTIWPFSSADWQAQRSPVIPRRRTYPLPGWQWNESTLTCNAVPYRDFQAVAQRVLVALGEPADSAKGRAVIDAHGAYWEGLRLAAGVGPVDLDRYAAAVSAPGWFEPTYKGQARVSSNVETPASFWTS